MQIRSEIPQWKVDKIINYSNGGWIPSEIAKKLGLFTCDVIGILYPSPTLIPLMGHKDEPYFKNEEDYDQLGRSPVPKIPPVSEDDYTLADLNKWLLKQKKEKLTKSALSL